MATYYVSGQNGNDSNNGTSIALARKSVRVGMAAMSAGDTLYIGPGTYRERLVNGDFREGSGVGSETKYIGDPDGNIFTNDLPGPVRITQKDVNERSTQTDDTGTGFYYAIGINKNHIHVHNWIIEGPGANDLETDGVGSSNVVPTNTFGVYMKSTTHNYNCVFFDCIISSGYTGVYGANGSTYVDNTMSLVRCIISAPVYSTLYVNTVHCIAIGARYQFTYGNHHGSIAIGGQYGFRYCSSTSHGAGGTTDYNGVTNNCYGFSNYYGFVQCGGVNNVAHGNVYGMWDNAMNAKWNGFWLGHCYRAQRDGEEVQHSDNIYVSQNYQNDYSSDGMTTQLGAGIIYNPNMYYHLVKALKPYDGFTTDYSNSVTAHGMQGWFSASNDPFTPTTGSADTWGAGGSEANLNLAQLTGSFDIEGNPYRPNNIRVCGPYTFTSSSLNFSTTSGSNPSIQIGGFGSKVFDIPVSASSNFTASVAVKYNSGTAPRLEITSSGLQFGLSSKSGSITNQIASATGTGDQTSAFQTLKVSSSVNLNDNVQLKLVQPDDNNASFAIFAQLQVEGE